MLRLTLARRDFLAEKLGDLANFAVTALVFGQAVGQDAFSTSLGFAGGAVWLALTASGFALKGGSR